MMLCIEITKKKLDFFFQNSPFRNTSREQHKHLVVWSTYMY